MKRLFVKAWVCILTLITIVMCSVCLTAEAEDYSSGGWTFCTATQNVRSANNSSASIIGTVYQYEGVTVLSQVGSSVYINYSTSNGAKEGWLVNAQIEEGTLYYSRAGIVNNTATVYYGPNTSQYAVAGTVYANEYVAAIAQSNGWVYIEYNTNSGRKRGYIPATTITTFGSKALDNSFYIGSSPTDISSSMDIYAGPTSYYPVIGSVSNERVWYGRQFNWYSNVIFRYIEYYITGTNQKKSGFFTYRE